MGSLQGALRQSPSALSAVCVLAVVTLTALPEQASAAPLPLQLTICIDVSESILPAGIDLERALKGVERDSDACADAAPRGARPNVRCLFHTLSEVLQRAPYDAEVSVIFFAESTETPIYREAVRQVTLDVIRGELTGFLERNVPRKSTRFKDLFLMLGDHVAKAKEARSLILLFSDGEFDPTPGDQSDESCAELMPPSALLANRLQVRHPDQRRPVVALMLIGRDRCRSSDERQGLVLAWSEALSAQPFEVFHHPDSPLDLTMSGGLLPRGAVSRLWGPTEAIDLRPTIDIKDGQWVLRFDGWASLPEELRASPLYYRLESWEFEDEAERSKVDRLDECVGTCRELSNGCDSPKVKIPVDASSSGPAGHRVAFVALTFRTEGDVLEQDVTHNTNAILAELAIEGSRYLLARPGLDLLAVGDKRASLEIGDGGPISGELCLTFAGPHLSLRYDVDISSSDGLVRFAKKGDLERQKTVRIEIGGEAGENCFAWHQTDGTRTNRHRDHVRVPIAAHWMNHGETPRPRLSRAQYPWPLKPQRVPGPPKLASSKGVQRHATEFIFSRLSEEATRKRDFAALIAQGAVTVGAFVVLGLFWWRRDGAVQSDYLTLLLRLTLLLAASVCVGYSQCDIGLGVWDYRPFPFSFDTRYYSFKGRVFFELYLQVFLSFWVLSLHGFGILYVFLGKQPWLAAAIKFATQMLPFLTGKDPKA